MAIGGQIVGGGTNNTYNLAPSNVPPSSYKYAGGSGGGIGAPLGSLNPSGGMFTIPKYGGGSGISGGIGTLGSYGGLNVPPSGGGQGIGDGNKF